MKTSEEHIDIMLFDYLEGNLSSHEVKQVEDQITSDPLIHEELNIWKEAYIHSDHYPTTSVLESQLLQSTGSFTFTLFLNSILVICLTIISGTNPKPVPFSTSPIQHQNLPTLAAKLPTTQIAYQQIQVEPEQMVSAAYFMSPENNNSDEHEQMQVFHVAIPELAMLTPDWIHYLKKHPYSIELEKGQDLKIVDRKELRKKERELRQWKKKAARERMANEFMKGDIPYVVPVNPNNF